MNRRGAGLVFCFMGSLLYISRFICVSIYGANHNIINKVAYKTLFEGIGLNLTRLGTMFLVIGFGYLIVSEILDTSGLINRYKEIHHGGKGQE